MPTFAARARSRPAHVRGLPTFAACRAPSSLAAIAPLLLYLDQNYLSGIAKRKPAFAALDPVLHAVVAAGAVAVVESPVHERESAPRPDLGLLELLRDLSGGRRLPPDDAEVHEARWRLTTRMARELPERAPQTGDAADLEAVAAALPRCGLITCDAFMADLVRRTGLDRRYGAELYTGRRADVERLTRRLASLLQDPQARVRSPNP